MADLLRICTAGSVDDGKSTLIGRLLYESRGLYEDQVRSVEVASQHRGVGAIDFSLFTDGLKAEREQGITIDVAYRYFATARRKFILADTPGHAQYTRNMATGASTADLAILLVDVRHGAVPQALLHARIARLLGIGHFVLAVNKMDLVHFDHAAFDAIVAEFSAVLGPVVLHAIPISALCGDNVTTSSTRTPWYTGPALLAYLETVSIPRVAREAPFRLPVQLVVRPHEAFRGYAGRVVSGGVAVGDPVTVLPSGRVSRITRLVTYDGDLSEATAGAAVTVTLDDDLDISRGDVLVHGPPPTVSAHFAATVVWMDERPLDATRRYRLKHLNRHTTAHLAGTLALNAIGDVAVATTHPLVFDAYTDNRATGSFIVIDADSHFTAGAGMITQPLHTHNATLATVDSARTERLLALAREAAHNPAAEAALRRAVEELP